MGLERGQAVEGRDVNTWAVREANWTYRTLGLPGRATREPVERMRLPTRPATLLAAFLVNELSAETRATLLPALLAAAHEGHEVIVVEPIARRLTPWWGQWDQAFASVGGRADEWRFPAELPPMLRDLDRAAGLNHRELTARTLRTQ